MNTKKNTKASPYPLDALWVRPPAKDGYADACSIRRVVVLSAHSDGFATIRFREGGRLAERHCNTSELASTPAKAAALLDAHLSALFSRPLQTAVAGMMEDSAPPFLVGSVQESDANAAEELARR